MSDDPSLSVGKYTALVVAIVTSSSLSMMGSAIIWNTARRQWEMPYQRFLCLLSAADFLNSLFLTLQKFLAPEGYAAIGNDATCNLTGFFFTFAGISVPMYSACLSLYFWHSLRPQRRMSQASLSRIGWAEKTAHATCWLLPLVLAVVAVAVQALGYEEHLQVCKSIEEICDDDDNKLEGEQPVCISGVGTLIYYVGRFIVLLASAVAIITSVLVWRKVRAALMGPALRRRASDQDEANLSSSMRSSAAEKRWLDARIKCALYTSAYFNSFLWPLLASFLKDSDNYYIFQLLAYFFYPLQGFFNAIIYFRDDYNRYKREYTQDSFWRLLRRTLSQNGDDEEDPEEEAKKQPSRSTAATQETPSDLGLEVSEAMNASRLKMKQEG